MFPGTSQGMKAGHTRAQASQTPGFGAISGPCRAVGEVALVLHHRLSRPCWALPHTSSLVMSWLTPPLQSLRTAGGSQWLKPRDLQGPPSVSGPQGADSPPRPSAAEAGPVGETPGVGAAALLTQDARGLSVPTPRTQPAHHQQTSRRAEMFPLLPRQSKKASLLPGGTGGRGGECPLSRARLQVRPEDRILPPAGTTALTDPPGRDVPSRDTRRFRSCKATRQGLRGSALTTGSRPK